MSDRSRQRNNTLAGLFVLLAIVGFVITIIVLSNVGAWWGRVTLVVCFPAEIGVTGLQNGADVSVAGYKAGTVTRIDPRLTATGTGGQDLCEGPHVRVHISLPREFVQGPRAEIRRDALAGLVLPLIGAGATIDITSLGTGELVAEGDEIRGGLAPSALLKTAGISPEDVSAIFGRIMSIAERADEILLAAQGFMDDDFPAIAEDVREIVGDVRAVTASVREKWPEWAGRADSILINVDETVQRGPELAEKAESMLDGATAGIDEIRGIVGRIEPDLVATAEQIRIASERVNDQFFNEASDLMADARRTLSAVTETVTTFNDELVYLLPDVKRMMGNLRLASDNLRLATMEIRAQPWRVLYQPKDREWRESELYAAARSYATAVADLEAAVVDLRALDRRFGPELDPASDLVQSALKQFEDRFQQYQREEERWRDIFFGGPAAGTTRRGSGGG